MLLKIQLHFALILFAQSLKIKQGYLEQLRNLSLVKSSLLPCLFELLRIGVAAEKPFSLSQWYVEEYYFNRTYCLLLSHSSWNTDVSLSVRHISA